MPIPYPTGPMAPITDSDVKGLLAAYILFSIISVITITIQFFKWKSYIKNYRSLTFWEYIWCFDNNYDVVNIASFFIHGLVLFIYLTTLIFKLL